MKKKNILFVFSTLSIIALAGCSCSINSKNNSNANSSSENVDGNEGGSGSGINNGSEVSYDSEPNIDGEFLLVTSDGTFTNSGSIYTITTSGTYTASGSLSNGQLYIDVDSSDTGDVVIELNNASIVYSENSPIYVASAEEVHIKALSGTSNLIKDTRSHMTTESTSQGSGAIYSSCDLHLNGSGTLVVNANYNNGVHCSDDLVVKNQNLQVTAYNNALKGADSVTIESGTLKLCSITGNGIKSENSDVSSKGNQRGNIELQSGNIYIDVPQDGIDASYDALINESVGDLYLQIYTGKYSSNSSNYSSSNSAKGIKAANEITIDAGEVVLKTSDDAIHANRDTTTKLGNGSYGAGNVTINNGYISINYAGDDGIHADMYVTINGGVTYIYNATEGIEANFIYITGGSTYVFGTDDGLNASKKSNYTPEIVVSGCYLDVAVWLLYVFWAVLAKDLIHALDVNVAPDMCS